MHWKIKKIRVTIFIAISALLWGSGAETLRSQAALIRAAIQARPRELRENSALVKAWP